MLLFNLKKNVLIMKKEIRNGYVALEAENGMVLHKVSEGYVSVDAPRRATVPSVEAAGMYEELSAEEYAARRLAEYKSRVYKDRLSAAVHERYSVDDEIALAANINGAMLLDGDVSSEEVDLEWAEYQAYRAECKARVRAEVAGITEVPEFF